MCHAPDEARHLVGRQSCSNTTACADSAPLTGSGEWDAFLIGMIGYQAKVLPGPRMLDSPIPWEIVITPVRIVTQDQLLRRLGNRVFTWEPGQIRQHQLPP